MSKLRPDKKNFRRENVKKANKLWRAKSPLEQLQILDDRLGDGVGAKKQRARILKKIKSNN